MAKVNATLKVGRMRSTGKWRAQLLARVTVEPGIKIVMDYESEYVYPAAL
jgi:hypothetical protein